MGRKKIEPCSFKIQGDTPARSLTVNSEDIVQWRYEMIRESALSREPIDAICEKYRYSRDMHYYYKGKFDAQGMMGLSDDKPGPRAATKRTADVDRLIIELRFKNPHVNMYEIAHQLNQLGVDISARSVSRTLEDHGLTLKKTKGRRPKKISLRQASSKEKPGKRSVE
jgi:transposase